MPDRINKENFQMLMGWLGSDEESAALKYEKIRNRLIRIFAGRGCHEAEELADETINRVAQKVVSIKDTYVGEPARYFHGVAGLIHLEWLRKQKQGGFVELKETGRYEEVVESDDEYECLEKCLSELPGEQRELIVEYYRHTGKAKIEHHKNLAEVLGISVNALQTKTCRIRAVLRQCVTGCLAGG
jgi:RNA polymerase sigma factor (sigma-70 family)